MADILHRVRRRLPFDGQGLAPSPDLDLRRMRRWAAGLFWRQLPWPLRPPAIMTARVVWLAVATIRALRFSRVQGLSARDALRVAGDCIACGAQPNESWIWRNVGSGAHPLPGRAAGLLLARLGDQAQREQLRDKQAAAEQLKQAGLPVPALHAVLDAGTLPDPGQLAGARPGAYFLKPRHGHGGRGTLGLQVVGDGLVHLDNGPPVSLAALGARLEALLRPDDLLVQEALDAAPELADLVTEGRPPVLRLTVARAPNSAPFLHSALLAIDVPGENPRHFIRGQVRAPIDPANGEALAGLWFLHPERRFDQLPWNGAQLSGRRLPGFAAAAEMALQASVLWPGVPLVNWDLILTPCGPVILEGNTGGDWILTNLSLLAGLKSLPLPPLLKRWVPAAARQATLAERWRRTSWADRILLGEALVLLTLARVVTVGLPFRVVAWLIGRLHRPGRAEGPPDLAARTRWAIEACARRFPFRAVCLQQGLAAHIMLQRRGAPSILFFGAARDDQARLIAHAWVRLNGQDVIGGEEAARFIVLAHFPDP